MYIYTNYINIYKLKINYVPVGLFVCMSVGVGEKVPAMVFGAFDG